MNTIIGLIALVSTAAGLGVFIYTEMIYKRPLPQEEVGLANLLADAKQSVVPQAFKLDKVTINLKSETGRLRFVDADIHLQPFEDKMLPVLQREENLALIYDVIIATASQMTHTELSSMSGKIIFEERVKGEINQKLLGTPFIGPEVVATTQFTPKIKDPVIRKIFFSRFVIQ